MMLRVTALSASLLSIVGSTPAPTKATPAPTTPVPTAPTPYPTGAGPWWEGNRHGHPVFLTPEPTYFPTSEPTNALPTPAPTMPVDCQGEWSDWGPCWPGCGEGKQYKFFFIKKYPEGWGMRCPTSTRKMPNPPWYSAGNTLPSPQHMAPSDIKDTVPFTRGCRTQCGRDYSRMGKKRDDSDYTCTSDADCAPGNRYTNMQHWKCHVDPLTMVGKCMEYPNYFIKKEDKCQVPVTDVKNCSIAASTISQFGFGLMPTITTGTVGSESAPFCYWEAGSLKFNPAGTLECSTKNRCICQEDGCRAEDNVKFKMVAHKERLDKVCKNKCNEIKKCRNFRSHGFWNDCRKCNKNCACTRTVVGDQWPSDIRPGGRITPPWGHKTRFVNIDKRLQKKMNPTQNRRRAGRTDPIRGRDDPGVWSRWQNGPVRMLQEEEAMETKSAIKENIGPLFAV